VHTPFARRLFNAAFFSCWMMLTEPQRTVVSEGLEKAMNHSQVFMQVMLGTAEFMSHCP
jgi:hypothetical protein